MTIAFGAGIITPIVTPIHQDETINSPQLENVINHIIEGGVDAIFPMGSTGEFARFDTETRNQVIAETIHATAGRKPVYAGVGDTGLRKVIRNIAKAETLGADVMVVTLPYYFPIRNDDEAVSFFTQAAASTRKPVMLYNIPSTCGASISLDAMERLFEVDNIIGVKDSSGDKTRLEEEIRRFKNKGKDFAIVVGAEELTYAGLKAGADGLVPSLSNPFPRLWADIYASALKKDWTRLKDLAAVVDEMNELNKFSTAWMSPNVWRKKALAHMGICDDFLTQPYVPVDDATDAKVQDAIRRYRAMYPEPVSA